MAFTVPIVPGISEPLMMAVNYGLVYPLDILRVVKNHTRISPKVLRGAIASESSSKRQMAYAELSIYFILQYTKSSLDEIAELFEVKMPQLNSILEHAPQYAQSELSVMVDIDSDIRNGLFVTIAYNPQTGEELRANEVEEIRHKYCDSSLKQYEKYMPTYIRG